MKNLMLKNDMIVTKESLETLEVFSDGIMPDICEKCGDEFFDERKIGICDNCDNEYNEK